MLWRVACNWGSQPLPPAGDPRRRGSCPAPTNRCSRWERGPSESAGTTKLPPPLPPSPPPRLHGGRLPGGHWLAVHSPCDRPCAARSRQDHASSRVPALPHSPSSSPRERARRISHEVGPRETQFGASPTSLVPRSGRRPLSIQTVALLPALRAQPKPRPGCLSAREGAVIAFVSPREGLSKACGRVFPPLPLGASWEAGRLCPSACGRARWARASASGWCGR